MEESNVRSSSYERPSQFSAFVTGRANINWTQYVSTVVGVFDDVLRAKGVLWSGADVIFGFVNKGLAGVHPVVEAPRIAASQQNPPDVGITDTTASVGVDTL